MNTVKSEKLQADVVIIGGGAAGLAAAVAADEAGAGNIIVLEAKKNTGGNGIFPMGIFAAGSDIQKSMAIDARPEHIFKKAMDYAHWKIDPGIVRTLIEKSADTIHWLEVKGLTFEKVIHHFPNQVPEVFHVVAMPQHTGAEVMRALQKCCNGPGIRFITQARAKNLVTDTNGKVTGVEAAGKSSELYIKTKSVVIATGGFAGNTDMVKKYFPTYDETEIMHLIGIRHKGDGLCLAAETGAAIGNDIVLEMGAPKYAGPVSVSVLISKPQTLWVNVKGQRFADESIVFLFSESANAVYRQPGKACFVLLDENIRQKIIAGGLDPLEALNIQESWRDDIDTNLNSQDGKTLKIANNWQDIAGWMGVPGGILQNTIETYNTSCNRGYDETFGKDREYLFPLQEPPFYAIKCGVDLLTTHGGIIVNENMQVLNKHRDTIGGLFAAGVDISGTDADSYNLNLSGHAFGFSINSGRIAGETAAKYASSLRI